MDLDPTAVQRRSELLAAGYSDGELRRMRSTGNLTRIRRGAYLAGAKQLDDVALHAMRIRAARPVLAPTVVISNPGPDAAFEHAVVVADSALRVRAVSSAGLRAREDAIRDKDLRMIRWTWPDLHPFDAVARRLLRAYQAS